MGYRLLDPRAKFSSPWDLYSQDPSIMPPAAAGGGAPEAGGLPQGKSFPLTPPMPVAPALSSLPNQAPGSGATLNANSEARQDLKSGKTETTFLTPDQIKAYTDSIRDIPEVKDQQQSQAANRELFKLSLAQKPQLDLASPLANLSDYVQTGKLGARAPQGETPQTKAKMIADFATKLQDDQRDIAKTILEGAQRFKSGTNTEQYLQYLATKLGEAKTDPEKNAKGSNPVNDYNKWVTSVDRDPVIKKTPDMLHVLSSARQMLAGNSPVDASNFKYELLRGLGVPRITNFELAGEQGSKALWDRLDQKLETLKSGALTETNKKDYMQLIDGISQLHQQIYDQHRQFHMQRGMTGYNLPKDKVAVGVNSLADPTGLGQVPTGRNAPQAPQPPAPTGGGDPGMENFLRATGRR